MTALPVVQAVGEYLRIGVKLLYGIDGVFQLKIMYLQIVFYRQNCQTVLSFSDVLQQWHRLGKI